MVYGDRLCVGDEQIEGIQVLDRGSLAVAERLPIDAAALAVELDYRISVIDRLALAAVTTTTQRLSPIPDQ